MTDTHAASPSPEADPSAPLVPGFAQIPERFWSARVRRMQGDETGERKLSTTDDDGLEVQWLYSPADALETDPGGVPGQAPFVRGTRIGAAWDIRQEHSHGEPRTANKQLLEDLVGGVTSFTLCLDDAARETTSPSDEQYTQGRGTGGIAISTVDDLDTVLEGVYLDLAPVALDAGAAAIPASALLRALWERRELDPATIRGSFGIDPLGTLAREGLVPGQLDDALGAAARVAAETAAALPLVQSLRIDTRAYVEAGATPALELAIAASTGAAYLRACAAEGLSPADAARQIEFQLTSGPVQFQEVAKLRAARRIWARILEASGVPAEGRRSPLYARASDRMLSRVDPWTNMLRGTTSLFAAAVGGATGATVSPFDALLGNSSTLGRRIARNTQIILLEESGLARVADPAGGSWFVEARTDALAREAWTQLQRIEREGGIAEALTSGRLGTQLAQLAGQRRDELVRRKRELTGVNTFPLLGDDGVEPDAPFDRAAFAERDRAQRAERPAIPALADAGAATNGDAEITHASLTALAAAGARIDELAAVAQAPLAHAHPLPSSRDAAPFEALRAASDASPVRVLLAPIGSIAATVAPLTWSRNFFAVAGIETDTPPEGTSAADALRTDGHRLVVICAGKGVEDDAVAQVITELREAGAERIVLALGKDDRAAAVGADQAVRDGIDMVAALADIHEFLDAGQQS